MLSALAVDQCFKSVHWQLMDFAMREENKLVMSILSGASLHGLLLCLDVLSMFAGHVYLGELLAEIPKITTPKLLLKQDTSSSPRQISAPTNQTC